MDLKERKREDSGYMRLQMKVFPKEESWASFTSRYFKSDSRRSLNISAGIDTKDSDSDSVANNGDDF